MALTNITPEGFCRTDQTIHNKRRPLIAFLILVFIALMMGGCATFSSTQGSGAGAQSAGILASAEDFPDIAPADIAIFTGQDVFKVGDLAEITVYNVESLTGTYVVNRSGDINFPLIGKVKVANLTTMSLQETLTEKYAESYLKNPNITVKIEAQKLGRIVVDGAVEQPGVFEVFELVNLSEAIALAGGVTVDANRKEIFLIRNVNGARKVRQVNLDDIRKLGASDPKIYPNDVVFVQDSGARIALREFLRTVPLLNTVAILATRR